MDLKKLSPSMLVVLGLACSRAQPPTVGPCLSPPYDPSAGDVGPCLSPPYDPSAGDVGPCLSPPEDPGDTGTTGAPDPEPDTGDEPPVGPCLSPPAPQPPGSTSVASVEPAAAHEPAASRSDALERVLARATLPADVAERLRQHTDRE